MKFLAPILLVLALAACDDGDDESTVAIPGDTVSAGDLAVPSNRGTASSSEMESFLGEDIFLAKKSDDIKVSSVYSVASAIRNEDDLVNECLGKDTTKLSAEGDTISVKQSINVAKCLQSGLQKQVGSNADVAISNASFGMNAKITCEGGDLSAYDGKNISEIQNAGDDLKTICEGKAAKIYSNVIGKISYNVSAGGSSMSAEASFKAIVASTEGNPCDISVEAGGHKSHNCVQLTGSVVAITTNGKTEKKIEFQKVVTENLVEDSDENKTYYKSGKQTVTFQNWTGTVEHAGTGFTYTFTNGSDEVEGTIGTVPALN